MFGLPRAHSAFIWSLLAVSVITVPYSVYMFMVQRVDGYHASADELAESLISEGATLTVVPVDTKSKTVDTVDKLGVAPIKITGMKLDAQDDAGLLDAIADLDDLRTLELQKISMKGRSLRALMENLHPDFASLKLINITDAADDAGVLQSINGRFQKLQTLNVQGMHIQDADVVALKGNTTLRNITLSNTEISDGAMVTLSSLPLTALHISNTNITSSGLQLLPRSLTSLSVEGLKITDEDMTFLASALPKLTALNIRATPITDAAIPALLRMTALKKLQLKNAAFTPEGVESLRAGFPDGVVQN